LKLEVIKVTNFYQNFNQNSEKRREAFFWLEGRVSNSRELFTPADATNVDFLSFCETDKLYMENRLKICP